MPNYADIEDLLTSAAKAMESKPYQPPAVRMLRARRGGLVELMMGTGKTLIALTAIFCFKPDRILIVCSRNAFWTWYKQSRQWYPGVIGEEEYVVVKGSPEKRQRLWASPQGRVFVTTYSTLRIDKEYIDRLGLRFDAVVGDELDRVGKYKRGANKKTGKEYSVNYKALFNLLRQQNPIFVGMAGKLRKKGRQDLWHYLHLIDPKMWSSYWKFVGTFCEVAEGFFGKEIVGTRNDAAFTKAIIPYLYTSDSAAKYLPPLNRQYLWVEMDEEQERVYRELEEQRYTMMHDGTLHWANNPLALYTKHRQLLVTPRLLGGKSWGSGLDAIIEKAQEAENRHFAIWTAFPSAIPLIVEFLHENGYSKVLTLRGGNTDDDVRRVELEFRRDPDTVYIGSIRFAQSFELESATLQFFLGPDWDVYENQSAEARLRRMTTTDTINSFFVFHTNTMEERVYEVLDRKQGQIRRTYADANDFELYWSFKS